MGWEQIKTLREAADALGLSHKALRDARDRGELRVYKLGKRWQYVSWHDVEAWMNRHATRPPEQPTA